MDNDDSFTEDLLDFLIGEKRCAAPLLMNPITDKVIINQQGIYGD